MSELRTPLLGAAAWVAAMVVAALVLSPYHLGLAGTIGTTALLALGLILVTGYAGQFTLAQSAFFGIGAYGSGLLTARLGWPPLLALLVSAAVAVLVAYALGRPVFRLRGHFLAMGTLALAEIFYLTVNNLDVTGASSGFGGIPFFSVPGVEFASLESQFLLVWTLLGAGIWAALRIRHSREGRALRAIRGHEAAAAACGIDVSSAKTRVFAGSALLGSVAGSVYAHVLLFINPPPFSVLTSVDVLATAVLGGLVHPLGSVAGALAAEGIRTWSSDLLPELFGAASVGAGETLLFGALFVLVLVVRPDGIMGAVTDLLRRVRRGEATPDRDAAADDDLDIGEQQGGTVQRTPRPPEELGEVLLAGEGLEKHFGGVTAVDGVDVVLHEGEVLSVIGPNGAGKSTLLNLLSGNLPPSDGTVRLLGDDVTDAPAHRVAELGLARTFQTPSLFPGMTVRETVLVGTYLRGEAGLTRGAVPTPTAMREEAALGEEVDRLLEELGLADLAEREAVDLSLGQQKVVEVGRALAMEPRVLLLDEPGAGLNRSEKHQLSRLLASLPDRGVSLLLIEHDMEFVMGLSDRVHVLDFGATLRVGTPSEVQRDPEVVAAYLGTDASDDDVVAVAAGQEGDGAQA